MLGVFLIGMAALLLYHRFSMNGLIEDKIEKLNSEMTISCAALDDEVYMTSAIPSAVNKSDYYTFIRNNRSEQLDRKYYSVLELIREDFANQVYLRGSASESLLYFRGTGSICTTRRIYTTFRYDALTVKNPDIRAGEPLTAEVTLTNTGKREGREIVELYLNDKVSSLVTPVQKLAAFATVTLAPGETKTIPLTIAPERMALWTPENKFTIEPGDFTLFAGYADHLILSTEFRVL